MKLNANTKIIGAKCVLVPYEAIHVPQYHNWMEDEEIRRLTASERLSMEEELEMQRSWREDEDKCTFIVLDNDKDEEISAMVGDVNVFINWDDQSAECEVMIAEPRARRKGIGREAMSLMISYISSNLNITDFFVRISDDNIPSIAMFEKMSFVKETYSEVFKEHTLRLSADGLAELKQALSNATVTTYRDATTSI